MGTVNNVPEKTFWKDPLTYLGNDELGKDPYKRKIPKVFFKL
jgi:hypothetical protein